MSNLEQLKAERGGKCINCRRFLRPDDEDHTFCNECWQLMVQHEFVSSDVAVDVDDKRYVIDNIPFCEICDEIKDNPIHTIKEPEAKCPNCGGVIFKGEGLGGVHETCYNEFKEYLETYDPINRKDYNGD